MNNLMFTLNAILPIVLPILLGFVLQKIKLFDKDFFTKCNKLAFRILLPFSLFNSLYLADISAIDLKFVILASLAIIILFFIGMILVLLFVKDNKQKGVIQQALFRSNYAIIGIPLAEALGGEGALALASIMAATSIPIYNILAVIALSIYDKEDGKKINFKNILKKIITNPLIIGVLCGIVVILIRLIVKNVANVDINVDTMTNYTGGYFIIKTIKTIANAATPIALIALGGKFEFGAVKRLYKQIVFSTALRLVIVPVIALLIFYFIGYKDSIYFAILISLFATPVAVSSAPMAEEMGQDGELAGQLVVWNSICSVITLFLIIIICTAFGIF